MQTKLTNKYINSNSMQKVIFNSVSIAYEADYDPLLLSILSILLLSYRKISPSLV